MSTRRLVRMFAVFAVVALVAAACSSGTKTSGGGTGASTKAPTSLNVAAIFISPVEEPWNTAFLQAFDRIKAQKPHGLTINLNYTENVAPPDAERVLRELAKSGKYQAIWAHSSFSDAVKVVAKEFPDILWAITGSGNTGIGGNVYWFYVWNHEPAYLMGIIAGKMTKSKVIGSVAAFPYDDVNAPLNAFFDGAKSVNPGVKVKNTYIESWFDPPKAKDAANAEISAGADFIYAERFGPFEAAAAHPGTYAFGHFVDQNSVSPKVVLTSALVKWDPTISQWIDAWYAHASKGTAYNAPVDKIYYLMKDGGADLAPFHDLASVIPQDVQDAVAAAKAQIMSGQLVVPLEMAPVKSN
jgi:basic membrane protein A and related proteins